MPKAHFIWGEALLAQQRLSCMWMTELARSLAGSLPLLFVLCFSRSPVSERTKRASERMERRRFGRARACSRPGQVVVRRTIPEKITKTNPKTRTALPVRRPARERGQKKKKKEEAIPPCDDRGANCTLSSLRAQLAPPQPLCPAKATAAFQHTYIPTRPPQPRARQRAPSPPIGAQPLSPPPCPLCISDGTPDASLQTLCPRWIKKKRGEA